MKLVFTLFLFLHCFFSAHAVHAKHASAPTVAKGVSAHSRSESISTEQNHDSRTISLPDVEEEEDDEILKKPTGKILQVLYEVFFCSCVDEAACTIYPRKPALHADSCKYIVQRTLRI